MNQLKYRKTNQTVQNYNPNEEFYFDFESSVGKGQVSFEPINDVFDTDLGKATDYWICVRLGDYVAINTVINNKLYKSNNFPKNNITKQLNKELMAQFNNDIRFSCI